MSRTAPRLWLTLILPLLACAEASAEMYRWKDANGNWQFGDRAPQAQHESFDVTPPSRLGQDDNVHAIHQRTLRLRESEQAEQNAREAQAQQNRQAREKVCQKARARLKQLHRPFVYIDDEGNQRSASADEVRADIAKTQQWINNNCNG